MRKLVLGIVFAAGMLLLVPASAAASTMPVPGGGPAFGQHVVAMTPATGQMAGAAFGACVSMMASQGSCDCPCNCSTP